MAEEFSGEFLIAEFNAIQNRAINLENIRSSRINFFLITTGAVIAGVGGVSGSSIISAYFLNVVQGASFILAIIGWVTLKYTLDDSVTIVYLWRYAARLRRYFSDEDEKIKRYLPFAPNDDRPSIAKAPISMRGMDATVLVLNALTIAITLGLFFANWLMMSIVFGISFLLFLIVLGLEIQYVNRKLKNEEDISRFAVRYPSPRIRQAKAEDLGMIAKIDHEAFSPYGTEEDAGIFKARLEAFPEGFIVIEKEGEVIAYGCSEKWKDARQPGLNEDPLKTHVRRGKFFAITGMAVRKDQRGNGFGMMLLDRLIRIAWREKCKEIILETTHAQGLYRKRNFRVTGSREQNGITLDIMTLELDK